MGQTLGRLYKIDEIRGATLISMILYHFMWDLKYIAGFEMEWYESIFAHVWQKSICITFILISGFCFSLSRNHLKRGLITFFSGGLVTLVTLLVMPENRVVFGILTFIGTAMLIMIPISKAHKYIGERINRDTLNITMLIASMLFFIVFYSVNYGFLNFIFTKVNIPRHMCKGYLADYIGFTDPTFYSTDYFSIFPWMFLFMFGYYLYEVIKPLNTSDADSMIIRFLKSKNSRAFEAIGKRTLIIYLLHQPVLYLITIIIMNFCR